ncbi:hypothetical protein SO802_013842 [Lithocarpus litseifolius]|uniref:Prokaryotic-type class I peptide chain release factors domain-containing protein n=1 Tax=Lithocarpus litseifolius TaxID=425828 RepID=A0AAW2D7E3_9ROSI
MPGEIAGIKRVTIKVDGEYAFGYGKAEVGVHRLVRISPFDSNKRRHTSFAAVAVIPIMGDGSTRVQINESDLRIERFRAGGAGGQHVNTTECAVRIVHVPTGVTATCQNERSQHQNKASAMAVLQSRLDQLEMARQAQMNALYTQSLTDITWGSQIRSYVLHEGTCLRLLFKSKVGWQATFKLSNKPLLASVSMRTWAQGAQLTHVLGERLKELAKDAEREKALKDVAVATIKDKGKVAEATEKKAWSIEKARLVAEKKLTEIADLNAALDACKQKWYNEGFADVENSVEPIVHQARHHGFGVGWLAALQAIGVTDDSPLRNPEQISFPAPSQPVQSQVDGANEEDTPSMRELVHVIDTMWRW